MEFFAIMDVTNLRIDTKHRTWEQTNLSSTNDIVTTTATITMAAKDTPSYYAATKPLHRP